MAQHSALPAVTFSRSQQAARPCSPTPAACRLAGAALCAALVPPRCKRSQPHRLAAVAAPLQARAAQWCSTHRPLAPWRPGPPLLPPTQSAAPLPTLQEATGYRLEVATVRRLEFENDTFAFGDKLIKKWYKGEQRVRPRWRAHWGCSRCIAHWLAARLSLLRPPAPRQLEALTAGGCTLPLPSGWPVTPNAAAAAAAAWPQDKAGILLVVSAGKDGALTGGDAFMRVRPSCCARCAVPHCMLAVACWRLPAATPAACRCTQRCCVGGPVRPTLRCPPRRSQARQAAAAAPHPTPPPPHLSPTHTPRRWATT